MDFARFDKEDIVAIIESYGFDEIRCSLTGKVVAKLDMDSMLAMAAIHNFEHPMASMDDLVEYMRTRWLIQSSRPAPHLTNWSTKLTHKFLHDQLPLDLFAILAGRLLFDNTKDKPFMGKKESMDKMAWLIELQGYFDHLGGSLATPEEMTATLELLKQLIQLDAIHDVRRCVYTKTMREKLHAIRETSFDFGTFAAFVNEIESGGMQALARMEYAPEGNSLSRYAAIEMGGMTAGEILEEEARNAKEEERRRAMNARNAAKAAKAGKVSARRIKRSKMDEILADAKITGDKSNGKKGDKPKSKAQLKAAARFGNLADFDLSF